MSNISSELYKKTTVQRDLPEGEYTIEIVNFEVKDSKASGNPMAVINFRVVDCVDSSLINSSGVKYIVLYDKQNEANAIKKIQQWKRFLSDIKSPLSESGELNDDLQKLGEYIDGKHFKLEVNNLVLKSGIEFLEQKITPLS